MAEVAHPLPRLTPQLRPFFEASRHRQLMVQQCGSCGAMRFPPRSVCSQCLSHESSWVPVDGRGEVLSFTVIHQVYHPAFAQRVPYVVAAIKLDGGARMISNLVAVDPAQVRCGMRVEVSFDQISEDVSLPVFRPASRPAV